MRAPGHAFALQHWNEGEPSPPELDGERELVRFRGLRHAGTRVRLVSGEVSESRGFDFVPCPTVEWLRGAPIVEFACYRVRPAMLEIHAVVVDAFSRTPGSQGVLMAHAVHDACHRLDLLRWNAVADHDAAPAVVRRMCPAMDRFFTDIESIELLDLFVLDE